MRWSSTKCLPPLKLDLTLKVDAKWGPTWGDME